MLEFETDSDTHFKCPQCGQQGSVSTQALKQALAETPHVHISCSACAHQFEPFAEKSAPPSDASAKAPADAIAEALTDQWQETTPDSEADSEADSGAGSEPDGEPANLPSWLMPSGKNIALPEADKEDNATPHEAVDEEAADEAGPIEAMPEETTEEPPMSEESTEEATEEPPAPQDAAFEATQPEMDAPDDELDESDAPHPHPSEAETPEDGEAVERAQAEAAEMPDSVEPPLDAPPPAFDETAPALALPAKRRDPIGWVNGVLLLVVVALVAMNAFILSGDETPSGSTAPANATAMPLAELASSEFEIIPDAEDNSVVVSVSFTNKDTQRAVIGDFRINLQNEARETLLSWTVLSSGETVTGGTTRTVSSTLFGPPAALAHLAIDYPLKN